MFQGNSSVEEVEAMGEEGIMPIIQNTTTVWFFKQNLHVETMSTLISELEKATKKKNSYAAK